MKNALIFLALVFMLPHEQASANHLLGGEMTYRCTGNGLYEFTVRVFRDCRGLALLDPTQIINHNVPGIAPLTVTRVQGSAGTADLSQHCPNNTTFTCGPNPISTFGPSGTGSMVVYVGTMDLSTAPAPPATGYVFTMNSIAASFRTPSNNMTGALAITLRVIMHRFTHPSNGVALTPAQICDNAPHFTEPPMALHILNPSDTVFFSNPAVDRDLDSLSFHIDFPWSNAFLPLSFVAPYSINNPWPGIVPVATSTGNVAIDPASSVITMQAIQAGDWLGCVRVDAWRCGQLTASIYRDFQMKVLASLSGSAPPYIASNPNFNQQRAPQIKGPAAPLSNSERWELYAHYDEDTLVIPITANDSFPFLPTANTFSLAVKGLALSNVNVDSTGCTNPPCATIRSISDPNPPASGANPPQLINRANGQPLGLGYANLLGQGGLKIVWVPRSNATQPNNNCSGTGPVWQTHRFNVSAVDNHCPVVGESSKTFLVHLLSNPSTQIPRLNAISNNSTARVLQFNLGLDTLSLDLVDVMNYNGPISSADSVVLRQRAKNRRLGAFRTAVIRKARFRNGPYVEVARISNPFVTSWTDTSNVLGQYYYIENQYGRTVLRSSASDTLPSCSIPNFQVVSSAGNFICNPGSTILSSSLSAPNLTFQWFRNGLPLANATTSTLQLTNSTGTFALRVSDTLQGCTKFSNTVDLAFFPPPFEDEKICVVSVPINAGRNTVIWNKTPGKHIKKYIIYRENTLTNQFDSIGNVLADSLSIFIDATANTQVSSWKYRIQIEDMCGNRSGLSPVHQTLHLSANQGTNNDVNLSWNPYQGMLFSSYNILRSHNGSPFNSIGNVPSTNLSFTDVNAPPGSKAYVIEVALPFGCKPDSNAASITSIFSNLINLGAGVGNDEMNLHKVKLQAYPNPTTGLLTIQRELATHEAVPIDILDAHGRLVKHLIILPHELEVRVDLSEARTGLYLLHCPLYSWTKKISLTHR